MAGIGANTNTPLRIFVVSLFWILFLKLLIPTQAQAADFNTCWINISGGGDLELKLHPNNTSDRNQCFDLNSSGKPIIRDRPLLSLDGCRSLCGRGFQYWPVRDTAKRFGYFLVPLSALATAFAFAAVGATSIPLVLLHLIGDPIDTIWSTLNRQEIARRNYLLALELAPMAAVDVAAVLTAYDQWWQDARKYFRGKIEGNTRLASPEMHPHEYLTNKDIYHIKYASHLIAEHRKTTGLLWAWCAIAGFLCSLAVAYVRTAMETTNNQVSHTLAAIMLFSWLFFAVYVTGDVGNFKRPTIVTSAIRELNTHTDLFPKILPDTTSDTSEIDEAGRYAAAPSWAGINNSFRPKKSLASNDPSDRSHWSLLVISISVVLTSFLCAFLLSYLTPAKGLGCRSFTWCCITAFWLVSALLDAAIVKLVGIENGRVKYVWYITLVKDTLTASASIGGVVAAQIGLMNSCWCRASAFKLPPKCIDIGPVTAHAQKTGWIEWIIIPAIGLAVIFFLIFLSGYNGDNGRLLLSRTEAELQADAKALSNMKKLGFAEEPQASDEGISQ